MDFFKKLLLGVSKGLRCSSAAWGSNGELKNAWKESNEFDISAQENLVNDMCINNAGTKIFIVGYNGKVYQYSWDGRDVDTMSYDDVSFDFSNELTGQDSESINFINNDMTMVIAGGGNIYAYDLGIRGEVTSVAYNGVKFALPDITDLTFNLCWSKAYALCGTTLKEYDLSENGNISTMSFVAEKKIIEDGGGWTWWDVLNFRWVVSGDGECISVNFSSEGKRVYILFGDTSNVNNKKATLTQYETSEAWSISHLDTTITTRILTLPEGTENTTFPHNGDRVYAIGDTGDIDDKIFQYACYPPVQQM